MRVPKFFAPLALVAALPAFVRAETPDRGTVSYLISLQQPDGGFLPVPFDPMRERLPSSLRATSSALRALKHFGGEPSERAGAARFVGRCFDQATGGFADRPGGKPDVPTTAVGVMAAVEVNLPPGTYRPKALAYLTERAKTFEEIRIAAAAFEAAGVKPDTAGAWLDEINKLRNPDGTYGKGEDVARTTGGAVAAVLRLGGTVENRPEVVKALRDGQRPDGGFGKGGAAASDLETTYRIMRSLVMLKEKPADPAKLRAFIGRCRNPIAIGGYAVTPGEPPSVAGSYYAGTILDWLGK
jgi:hypothetical protein